MLPIKDVPRLFLIKIIFNKTISKLQSSYYRNVVFD